MFDPLNLYLLGLALGVIAVWIIAFTLVQEQARQRRRRERKEVLSGPPDWRLAVPPNYLTGPVVVDELHYWTRDEAAQHLATLTDKLPPGSSTRVTLRNYGSPR